MFLSLCLGFTTLISPAQENSNPRKENEISGGYHKLNFSFTFLEIGASIPFKEDKLRALPYGMNTYLYSPKGGIAGNLYGVGLYYKNHWGISAILLLQDYSVPDVDFNNYISSKYPGYFSSSAGHAHFYQLYGINYRLSYRFQKGRFVFEPQFQLGINDCNDYDSHFVLKEVGSNNFVEYDIKSENTRRNLFSYHAAIVVRKCFTKPDRKWITEPNIRFDFFVIPTNFNYTITSTPYNMPATIHNVNVKQMRPTLIITAGMSFFRK
jgi:hypothetical protein